MVFEPATVFLRRLRLGEAELIRGIYAAVRDRNWGAVPPRLQDLRVERGAEHFRLTFQVSCQQREIDFSWNGELSGAADGTIVFAFEGEARSSFLRNRIGLCLLHPLKECSERPCVAETVDGQLVQSSFPRHVAPHQPFRQIRSLKYELAAGLWVEARFEGEVFETEDQRNWTDASFKTYGTPLELPFPVPVERGTRISQRVTIKLHGDKLAFLNRAAGAVEDSGVVEIVAAEGPTVAKPPIGLAVASHQQALDPLALDRLKQLALSHLRVDLLLGSPEWRTRLRRAAGQARQLGAGLHAALFLSEHVERELEELVAEMRTHPAPVTLWLVFPAAGKANSEKLARQARQSLALLGGEIPLAAGTNAYFAELNRNRLPADVEALPSYSLNPQVHAFDEQTMIENLEAQPHTVESAWHFARRPVVVSSVTLRPRFNPDATAAAQETTPGELPPEVDVRQLSLFAAGWTLGSLGSLSLTGHVHSLTYYETTGWRGIMETPQGSPCPSQFPSRPNTVFPLYFVFAELAGSRRLAPAVSSRPLQAQGLTTFDEQGRRAILLANLANHPILVRLRTSARTVRGRFLDETNLRQAARDPAGFLRLSGEARRVTAGCCEVPLRARALARLDLDY
jgi:hypothetical protein